MKFQVLPLLLLTVAAQAQTWQIVQTQNEATPRHENAAALVGDDFYAIGGRGTKPLEALNLKSLLWRKLPPPPVEMNHFQAITYGGEIYVLGAFKGPYPHETPLPVIYIYDPKKGEWREGPAIPTDRLRGSAGVVVHNNKIYMVCGIIDGHWDGHVAWFDEFDPKTGTWNRLPDAPRPRDHISATMVGSQLILAGGRNSTARIGKVLETTIAEVDVYDFKTGRWETLPAIANIPTQRAGATAVTLNGKAYVIGGETPQLKAHNQAEAFDPKTATWTPGPTLQTGRHGTQAVVHGGKIYILAGSENRGGGPELKSVEVMK